MAGIFLSTGSPPTQTDSGVLPQFVLSWPVISDAACFHMSESQYSGWQGYMKGGHKV